MKSIHLHTRDVYHRQVQMHVKELIRLLVIHHIIRQNHSKKSIRQHTRDVHH